MKSRRSGICSSCLQLRQLEKHHILPRKFFKRQRNAPIVYLCNGCHKQLHRELPEKKVSKSNYLEITQQFLENGYRRYTPIYRKHYLPEWQATPAQEEIMALKCSNCCLLRIRLVCNVVQSHYCVLTGEDVSPHDFACQSYRQAKDEIWIRNCKKRRK